MQTVSSTRRRDGFHEIFCTKMDFLSEVGRQTKGRSCLNLTSLYLVWFNHFFRQKVIVPAPEGRTRFIFPLRRLCCASFCVGYMKTNDTGGEGDLDVLTSALLAYFRLNRPWFCQTSERCWTPAQSKMLALLCFYKTQLHSTRVKPTIQAFLKIPLTCMSEWRRWWRCDSQ